MSMMKMMIALGAGGAAIAASVPASAQYYSRDGYARSYAANTNYAARQCSAEVQSHLYNRTSGGIIGAIIGEHRDGRVLSVTQAYARGNGMVRVSGLASSGRYAMNDYYGPNGVGDYGALGYNYSRAADLSFRCDVAPNGAVFNVSIDRR